MQLLGFPGRLVRMKKVALTLIAQQLKDDDLKELRETFIQLDKNRDGTLSCWDILGPLCSVVGFLCGWGIGC